jgi:aspartyl protease family protein
MAFRGGMRRAMSEAGLWLAVAGTAAVSFYFFEDVYRVLEKSWPKLQVSFAPGAGEPAGAVTTARQDNTASLPEPHGVVDLRPTDTGLTELVQSISRPVRRVTLTANHYGHFVVQAEINGAKVELLTDTGATYVALNYDTAIKLGFDPKKLDFSSRSSTANGIARVAPVDLEQVRIGSIMLKDVKAVIAEPGKMTQNLLGMSFIRRLSGFELSGELLNMTQN